MEAGKKVYEDDNIIIKDENEKYFNDILQIFIEKIKMCNENLGNNSLFFFINELFNEINNMLEIIEFSNSKILIKITKNEAGICIEKYFYFHSICTNKKKMQISNINEKLVPFIIENIRNKNKLQPMNI